MSAFMIKANDAKNFVFFSPATKGGSGKPVKINAALLPKFISLVDPKSHDGQMIIRHIQGLSAKAGQAGSMQNMNNAFAHMDSVKHVQIFYRIMQLDANSPVGVYITDLRYGVSGDDMKPGLYMVNMNSGPKPLNAVKLSGTKIAINGQSEDLKSASDSALELTSSSSAILFYNPSAVVNELGIWSDSAQRTNKTLLATEMLSKVLVENQNRDNTLEWYVEGEGTELLGRALAKVKGELTKFKFHFIDPIGDTTSALNLLKTKKAQLATEVVKYTGKRASTVSLLTQRSQLASVIKSLVSSGHPLYQDREKSVAKLMTGTSTKAAQYSGAVNTIKGGQVTFTDALRQLQGIV